jgi:hypothetical protein
MKAAPLLLLLMAAPAAAQDWRSDCPDLEAEARRAAAVARFCGAQDYAYLESQRWLANHQALAQHLYSGPVNPPQPRVGSPSGAGYAQPSGRSR